jgi:predicted transcriptional regulator
VSKPKVVLKPRQRKILEALKALGGEASVRDIAHETGFNVNGVSQSLGATHLGGQVQPVGDGRGGQKKWKVV